MNKFFQNIFLFILFSIPLAVNSETGNLPENSDNQPLLGVVPVQDVNGVMIKYIIPHSSASKSELNSGDLILKINSSRINSPIELVEEIKKYKTGDEITVEFFRKGEIKTTSIKLGKRLTIQSLVNLPAPEINLPVYGSDKNFTPSGKKILIVFFWATWCKPCRIVKSELEKFVMSKQYPEIDIIAITNEPESKIKTFYLGKPSKYPVLIDENYITSVNYMVTGYPTIAVIDTEGIIQFGGFATNGGLQLAIDTAIRLENKIR